MYTKSWVMSVMLVGLLGSKGSLREILQACAEAIVRQLDAAFARIWTLDLVSSRKSSDRRNHSARFRHKSPKWRPWIQPCSFLVRQERARS